MITATTLCLLGAFIVTILAAIGKAPLWVGVLLLVLAVMITTLPR